MEMVGPRKRLYAGIVTNYFFAFGIILLGLIAYVLKDWFWIELCLSVPTVFYLSYWWWVSISYGDPYVVHLSRYLYIIAPCSL